MKFLTAFVLAGVAIVSLGADKSFREMSQMMCSGATTGYKGAKIVEKFLTTDLDAFSLGIDRNDSCKYHLTTISQNGKDLTFLARDDEEYPTYLFQGDGMDESTVYNLVSPLADGMKATLYFFNPMAGDAMVKENMFYSLTCSPRKDGKFDFVWIIYVKKGAMMGVSNAFTKAAMEDGFAPSNCTEQIKKAGEMTFEQRSRMICDATDTGATDIGIVKNFLGKDLESFSLGIDRKNSCMYHPSKAMMSTDMTEFTVMVTDNSGFPTFKFEKKGGSKIFVETTPTNQENRLYFFKPNTMNPMVTDGMYYALECIKNKSTGKSDFLWVNSVLKDAFKNNGKVIMKAAADDGFAPGACKDQIKTARG